MSDGRQTYFHGGPLNGQWFASPGATYYMHDRGDGRYAEYRRLRSVYSNGDTYANDANQSRLSHLEYVYTRDVPK